jgi:hypothetical protein
MVEKAQVEYIFIHGQVFKVLQVLTFIHQDTTLILQVTKNHLQQYRNEILFRIFLFYFHQSAMH